MSKTIFLKISLVVFSMLVFASCKKSGDEQIQDEPPAAIKQLIAENEASNPDCFCHPLIKQYMWKGENVYVASIDDAANLAENKVCDWIPIYYNSKGETFSPGIGPEHYQRFLKQSQLIRTVWSCQ